jgi:hypothetical protein
MKVAEKVTAKEAARVAAKEAVEISQYRET